QAEIETYAEAEKLFCVSVAMIREKLLPALEHFIIMDDVTLTDDSARYGTLTLEGPKVATLTMQLCGVELESLLELGWKDVHVGSIPCLVVQRLQGGNLCAEFVCEQLHLPSLWNLLRETAKANGGGPVGYTA